MKNFLVIPIFLFALFLACPSQAAQLINVTARKAQEGSADITKEYIGTVEAIQRVTVRPELSAKISRVHFNEGSYVKAGSTLFSLESSQYKANVDLRKAQLARSEAALDRAQKYMKRLKAADKKSISASDIDNADNDIKQAQASIAEAKANLLLAQIDLNRTRITAPISGVTGRASFTKGNYITTNSELTSIIQMNPIRVAFSISEADYASWHNNSYTTELILSDGSSYSESGSGKMDFADNSVNTSTGTVTMRWSFTNNNNILLPGAMVRIVFKPINETKGVLVPQASVLSDLDGNYVFVIEGDTAKIKRVKSLGTSGENMVVSGVKSGDIVALYGIQSLSDGAKVNIQDK